ncbi:MAG TPA: DNA cytosine methyltransferase [Hyphomicrobium sp.]|nr:DNA cytosine methyltransferase [Hyphomicrobium sp.]
MVGYSLELCAGAGGQALGLERAGFEHAGVVEIDPHACNTLRINRPRWAVHEEDLNHFDARLYRGADLVAGGFPCPPFSIAGKKLGAEDERDCFPAGLRIIDEVRPKAVMIENVKGILDPKFAPYREQIDSCLNKLGYVVQWKLLNAADYGVSQLRPRVVIVALKRQYASEFKWPEKKRKPKTVGQLVYDLMAAKGWHGAEGWKMQANAIAPTIVGGSKKHGGPDLGPTRARKAWAALGVDGLGIANEAPDEEFEGMPRLTTRMVARIQGFPDQWGFWGKKTAAYRQVGNAFPPPVAFAVASEIAKALARTKKTSHTRREAVWQTELF